MRRFITLTLLAAVAVPAFATAQEPADRERTYTFRFGPGDHDFAMLRRGGRLGITVDLRPDAARDSIGALVSGVTPGGAAERAGVRAGDIAVRFNGARLAAPIASQDERMARDESHPAHQLIRFASRLDPGDTVRLEIRRDGRSQTFTFQAEESDMDMLVRRMPLMIRDRIVPEIGRMMVSVRGALNDIELVKVNPGLGEYFGTTEGLLVTNVGGDSALGLRSGDVILSIGGRRPTSAPHAMRILSTYDPNEAVQFEVMRQRRRTTVNGRIPEPREGTWRVRPNSFEIPNIHILPRAIPRIELELPLQRRGERTIIKT